jgi:hypothetical protein
MRIKTALTLALILELLMTGCASENVAYVASATMSDKDASALVKNLTLSQEDSNIKPSRMDILETYILWGNDRIFFNTVTYAELLKKSNKYSVQINLNGDVFRGDDWYIAYRTDKIDDAKRYLDALASLIASRNKQTISIAPAPPNQTLATPNKITAPTPIAGNSGKFMSPFTAAGAVALWAKKPVAATDNGSTLAATAGGAAGQYAADKALSFVPFGLGGMIGRKAGESAARAATKTNLEPELPSMNAVIASSDISFNSADDLAVFLYAKHSSRGEYAQVLALAEQVYPELKAAYTPAIEKASQPPAAKMEANPQERLKALRQLKADHLISESDYESKKKEILKSL